MVLRLWFWQQTDGNVIRDDGECGKCSGMGKVNTAVLDTELEALMDVHVKMFIRHLDKPAEVGDVLYRDMI